MEFFEKATPESCGISSKDIINFINKLCQVPENLETHSVILLRHGKVVCEGYFAPYNKDTEHSLFSVSKSFTGMAIGYLVQEGKISIELYIHTYFPELITDDINKENLKIKIKDLLSMTFGQKGGAVHEGQKRSDAMLYDFFYREKDIECGKEFRYDSYGTYMLAALVKKLTGMNTVEYLMPKLFEPLNIKKPYYLQDSIGINVGYTGMRMKARDLLKVGYVYLQGGKWEGKQIADKSWIDALMKKHISSNSSVGEDWQQGYCYQLWKGRYNTTRLCGAHGQMCVIMPDYDALLVINSGYDNTMLSYVLDSFYENVMFKMKPEPIAEDKESYEKLENVLDSLKLTFKFSEMSPMAQIVNGNTYEIPQKGIYSGVKFNFSNEDVEVTLVSDKENFTFTAGFTKPVWGKTVGTHFSTLEQCDNSETVATAVWNTKKDLEITLRLFGTPSIVKVIADFSDKPEIKLETIRCKF